MLQICLFFTNDYDVKWWVFVFVTFELSVDACFHVAATFQKSKIVQWIVRIHAILQMSTFSSIQFEFRWLTACNFSCCACSIWIESAFKLSMKSSRRLHAVDLTAKSFMNEFINNEWIVSNANYFINNLSMIEDKKTKSLYFAHIHA